VPKPKKKGFTDYQPKGFKLPGFFKYIPDAYQVSDYIKATLARDGAPANPDGKATKGKTKAGKKKRD